MGDRSVLRLALILGIVLAGCTPTGDDDDSSVSDDDDSTPEPTTGTLAVSFRIDKDWRDNMDEPAVGSFWGTIFDSDDVTGLGPKEKARAYGDIFVADIDLSDEHISAVLHTTDELPATWVTILGFMDSDGNSVEDDRDPDDGDPVTRPTADNEFLVVAGEETPAEVVFNFLNP